MQNEKMSGVTLAAFMLAYLDVLSRFVGWSSGGGLLVPIISLILVVSANCRQNWARIIWTLLKGFGVIVLTGFACSGKVGIGITLFSIAVCVAEMICFWHPKSNEWFSR